MLLLEPLEDRSTPSVAGLAWPDPQHLTLSFAPDSTELLGANSQLFHLLDAMATRADWQTEILRAFQTWAVLGNVNIGLVEDGGQPFGSAGALQGDSRFGDIRIGTYPLSDEVIAVASGFDLLAGTWSGDVKLNSAWDFGLGGEVDLFSVMLHEAGHVFGLEHSDDPASVMFATLQFVNGLSLDDVARFQTLYGTRAADEFDRAHSNDVWSEASNYNHDLVEGDLTTLDDVDWYSFHFQGNATEATIRLQTAGFSLLSARITVVDGAGNVLGSAESAGPLDGDLELHLTRQQGSPKQYYVKSEKARADVFGIGGYRVQIDAGATEPADQGQGPPAQEDRNDSRQAATNLLARAYRVDNRFDYAVAGSLTDGNDIDFYRFKAPPLLNSQGPLVLTAVAWSTQPLASENLELTFYDVHGNPIHAEVLTRSAGSFTLQLADASSEQPYLLSVRSADGGDYFLAIDFGTRAVELLPLVDHLPAEGEENLGTLHVLQSQLFHFVIETQQGLSTDAWNLTVVDQHGSVVQQVGFSGTATISSTFYLTQGDYTFMLTPANGSSKVVFSLRGIGLSDPVGPEAVDATLAPIGTSASSRFSAWWDLGFLGLLPTPSSGNAPGVVVPPSVVSPGNQGDPDPGQTTVPVVGVSGPAAPDSTTPGPAVIDQPIRQASPIIHNSLAARATNPAVIDKLVRQAHGRPATEFRWATIRAERVAVPGAQETAAAPARIEAPSASVIRLVSIDEVPPLPQIDSSSNAESRAMSMVLAGKAEPARLPQERPLFEAARFDRGPHDTAGEESAPTALPQAEVGEHAAEQPHTPIGNLLYAMLAILAIYGSHSLGVAADRED
ncbi:MAG: matrixin family metalloprotease [Gemmataceae bacterium]